MPLWTHLVPSREYSIGHCSNFLMRLSIHCLLMWFFPIQTHSLSLWISFIINTLFISVYFMSYTKWSCILLIHLFQGHLYQVYHIPVQFIQSGSSIFTINMLLFSMHLTCQDCHLLIFVYKIKHSFKYIWTLLLVTFRHISVFAWFNQTFL